VVTNPEPNTKHAARATQLDTQVEKKAGSFFGGLSEFMVNTGGLSELMVNTGGLSDFIVNTGGLSDFIVNTGGSIRFYGSYRGFI